MHEMLLAEGILAVVLDVAQGEHVREIRVRAGALQRLVPDSLQLCLDQIAAGTSAADAVLTVDVEPAVIACSSCEAVYELTTPPFMCGACGESNVQYLSGDELRVDAVHLDSGWLHRPDTPGSGVVTAARSRGRLAERA